MTLAIRASFPKNVFELLGKNENSATYALGWALERSPALISILAEKFAAKTIDAADMRIELQAHSKDRGFTDMELRCGDELHAILEAKQGFSLPGIDQLRRYRPRLDAEPALRRVLVSVSAISERIANRRLPSDIAGVPVMHVSWGTIRGMAKAAREQADGFEEKLWLRELIIHLEGYAAMERTRDNMVYVVSLSSNLMREDGKRTWIDVVEKDRSYFHPVGNTWPTQPPNYIAFRYWGQVQSIHRIESHDIVFDVSTVDPTWATTNMDHFVYRLGPAMRPPTKLGAGGTADSIRRSARVWCSIDTLLTGEFKQLGEARDETKRRLIEAEASNE
ncbi:MULTISPECIES: hypothetical protein [unclassified Delftia]|uniref:hypothetical protein n=1 Tax=unclassified Delftia TaxID=2613839 RepID=UPI0019020EC1|nr:MULTISPECIES: hypothetical protein [unclassified Delftia]MBK0115440.1 hypothetical protein [Delftia sp. S65]MBK0121702.1 hypothetical protein [Delftia sp. S67]MBK0133729.1 hypothetical protein [Delftia sp. S66]